MFSHPMSSQTNNKMGTLSDDSSNFVSNSMSQMIQNNQNVTAPIHINDSHISYTETQALSNCNKGLLQCETKTLEQNILTDLYSPSGLFDYFDAWRPDEEIEKIGNFSEQNAVISFLKKRDSLPKVETDSLEYNSFQEDSGLISGAKTQKFKEIDEGHDNLQSKVGENVLKDSSGRQFLSFSKGSDYSFYGSNIENYSRIENTINLGTSDNNKEIINQRAEPLPHSPVPPLNKTLLSVKETVPLNKSKDFPSFVDKTYIASTAPLFDVSQSTYDNKNKTPSTYVAVRNQQNFKSHDISSDLHKTSLNYRNNSSKNYETSDKTQGSQLAPLRNKVLVPKTILYRPINFPEHSLNNIQYPISDLVRNPYELQHKPLKIIFYPLRTEKSIDYTEPQVEKINKMTIINSFCVRNVSSNLYFGINDLSDSPFSYLQPLHYYVAPKPLTTSAPADWPSFVNNFQSLIIKDSTAYKDRTKNTENKYFFKSQQKLMRRRKPRNFAEKTCEKKLIISGCKFCKSNCETKEIYSSHQLKQRFGNRTVVTCPVLRRLVCERCGGTGDNAHTKSYCPVVIAEKGNKPLSVANELKKTKRFASGKVRRGQY